MKTVLPLLLFSLSAFAQTPATAAKPIDKVKVEQYLRHLELWVPQVAAAIDDPKPSKTLPGFNDLDVHLTFGQNQMDMHYLISQDGQKILKADVYDINKSPFQANLDKLKTDLQPSFGTPGAPVVLVVFGDFQCPYCKAEANTLRNELPAAFPDKVRVYFKDFPLDSIHPWAHAAAIAGRCVFREDPQAFWKYHDWAYENQQGITPETFSAKFNEWVGKAGIDAVKVARCIDTKATEPDVTKSIAEGRALGVDGTPTIFMNGRKLADQMAQWQNLQLLINFEIDHQGKVADAGEKCCEVKIPTLTK